jgi:malate dehydrogenase (quinone)
MITVLERCFPGKLEQWKPTLRDMVPSYGSKLSDDVEMAETSQSRTAQVLGLVASQRQ